MRNEETPSGESEEEVRYGQLFGSKIAFTEGNWWGEEDATLRFAVTRVSRIATRNEEKQEGKKKTKIKHFYRGQSVKKQRLSVDKHRSRQSQGALADCKLHLW